MKLYSYIVKFDRGLAPNPFWGYCTLAVCTPNHMGIKAKKDDWFVGFSPKDVGNKLVYAMQVSETLNFSDYYNDIRFQNKKPKMNGNWKERCGDNFYMFDPMGNWLQDPNPFHQDEKNSVKDTKYPLVFISEIFYYFGEKSVQIPEEFRALILDRQGCKCSFDEKITQRFLFWLKQNYQPGVHGDPALREKGCEIGC
jgi:hypothetical protein